MKAFKARAPLAVCLEKRMDGRTMTGMKNKQKSAELAGASQAGVMRNYIRLCEFAQALVEGNLMTYEEATLKSMVEQIEVEASLPMTIKAKLVERAATQCLDNKEFQQLVEVVNPFARKTWSSNLPSLGGLQADEATLIATYENLVAKNILNPLLIKGECAEGNVVAFCRAAMGVIKPLDPIDLNLLEAACARNAGCVFQALLAVTSEELDTGMQEFGVFLLEVLGLLGTQQFGACVAEASSSIIARLVHFKMHHLQSHVFQGGGVGLVAISVAEWKAQSSLLVDVAIQVEATPFWQQKVNQFISDLPAHLVVAKGLEDAYGDMSVEDMTTLSEPVLRAMNAIVKNLPEWRTGMRSVSAQKLDQQVQTQVLALVASGKADPSNPLNDELLSLLHAASIALPMNSAIAEEHQSMAASRVKDVQDSLVDQFVAGFIEAPSETLKAFVDQIKKHLQVGKQIHVDCVSKLQAEHLTPWVSRAVAVGVQWHPDTQADLPTLLEDFVALLASKAKHEKLNVLARCFHLVFALKADVESKKFEADAHQAVSALQISRVNALKLQQQLLELQKVVSVDEKAAWADPCGDLLQKFQESLSTVTKNKLEKSATIMNRQCALLTRHTSKMKGWQAAKSQKSLTEIISTCKQSILQVNPQEHAKAHSDLSQAIWIEECTHPPLKRRKLLVPRLFLEPHSNHLCVIGVQH
eukprot:6492740-Amphidinium_carterae.4